MTAKHDTAWLQKQAQNIHGDKYDLSHLVYDGRRSPITVGCPIHGSWVTTPASFITLKSGCPKCAREAVGAKLTSTKDYIVQKAHLVHGNKYDYGELSDRVTQFKPVPIKCPIHGTFHQKIAYHLQGNGCPHCGRELKLGRYDDNFFVVNDLKKLSPATIYFVQIHRGEEQFYKIGITARSLKHRYRGKGVVVTVEKSVETNLYTAYMVEQQLRKMLRPYQYIPKFQFEGRYECFTKTPEVYDVVVHQLNTIPL